jgi:hypothetical protein
MEKLSIKRQIEILRELYPDEKAREVAIQGIQHGLMRYDPEVDGFFLAQKQENN